MNRLSTRCVVVASLLAVPTASLANGAMSMALATFEWLPWLAYVAFTVVFEAWFIGRFLRIPFFRALLVSCYANFVTAMVGVIIPCFNMLAYTTLFGTSLNPNPFLNTLAWFTIFGLLSAAVETLMWRRPANRWALSIKSPVKSVFLAHLVGIPLGMAILLIPNRPYAGLEGRIWFNRHVVRWQAMHKLPDYVGWKGFFPRWTTMEQALRDLRQFQMNNYPDTTPVVADVWAAAYEPQYGRFDLTENRRAPYEWNRSLGGQKLEDLPQEGVWLARCKTDFGLEGYFLREATVHRIFIPNGDRGLSPEQKLLLAP